MLIEANLSKQPSPSAFTGAQKTTNYVYVCHSGASFLRGGGGRGSRCANPEILTLCTQAGMREDTLYCWAWFRQAGDPHLPATPWYFICPYICKSAFLSPSPRAHRQAPRRRVVSPARSTCPSTASGPRRILLLRHPPGPRPRAHCPPRRAGKAPG